MYVCPHYTNIMGLYNKMGDKGEGSKISKNGMDPNLGILYSMYMLL